MSICIKSHRVCYEWYRKADHSGITLHFDSWLPDSTKRNFIRNTISTIHRRCSNDEVEKVALKTFDTRLKLNGYPEGLATQFSRNLKKKIWSKDRCDSTILTLPYINESLIRRVNRITDKYDFDIKVIFKPNKYLSDCFHLKEQRDEHQNCAVCHHLENGSCEEKNVVYRFVCKRCQNQYIGQTNRPFYQRYTEHKNSIIKGNKANNIQNTLSQHSALLQHMLEKHPQQQASINQYKVQIIHRTNDPIRCRLAEAREIKKSTPEINRKTELTYWW